MTLNELHHLGFVRSAACFLVGDRLRIDVLENSDARNILYAFVQNETIKYIGYTRHTFSKRLRGYQNPSAGQRTNLTVNAKLIASLSNDLAIDVYCFSNPEPQFYRGTALDVAAALEIGLITQAAQYHNENNLEPLWNIMGNVYARQATPVLDTQGAEEILFDYRNEPEDGMIQNIYPVEVEIILGDAYFNHGYFNLPIAVTALIAAHGEALTVELVGGGFDPIVDKTINRTANLNGAPRFHLGHLYTNWVQHNHDQGDTMYVRILSPNHIQLR